MNEQQIKARMMEILNDDFLDDAEAFSQAEDELASYVDVDTFDALWDEAFEEC